MTRPGHSDADHLRRIVTGAPTGREAPPSRAAAGRVAKAAGDGHEAALDALHALYRREGRADIRRRPHEVGMRPDGARMVVTRREATGCDFAGTLRGGRSLAVEAKTVAEGGVRGASLTGLRSWSDAELDELRQCARLGGVACVVADVRGGEWSGRYVVPVVGGSWNFDRAPVPLTGPVAENVWGVVRVGDGTDWLGAVESMGMAVFGAAWPHEEGWK